ncbi:MAG: hypothetical protein P4M11_10425, partial [Candidatus Pacebacteria bacterium]|nr:hypothetical protein [Candidatus Paceibacterota bacterium]
KTPKPQNPKTPKPQNPMAHRISHLLIILAHYFSGPTLIQTYSTARFSSSSAPPASSLFAIFS